MERIPRGVYTRELPEEAVKLVVEGGESNLEVGRRLSIAASVPHGSLHESDCYDNAPMESFLGTLKSEHIHHRRYLTRQEAIQDITEYVEVFDNRQGRQARLGYLSPAAYERQYNALRIAA